jgi:hypothetical protein
MFICLGNLKEMTRTRGSDEEKGDHRHHKKKEVERGKKILRCKRLLFMQYLSRLAHLFLANLKGDFFIPFEQVWHAE